MYALCYGLLFALAMLVCSPAQAMSGKPQEPVCDPAVAINGNYDRVQCTFDHKIYSGKRKREIPVSFVVPTVGQNLTLEVMLHRDSSYPAECTNGNHARAGVLLIKNCANHWPDRNLFEASFCWWGACEDGIPNTFRIAKSFDMAKERWSDRIDHGKGGTLSGGSYGGTGCILQSILLGDRISICNAMNPHLLFVKRDENLKDGDDRGEYWRNPRVRSSWGSVDPDKLDIRKAMADGTVRGIYYRTHCSTIDSLGRCDQEFFDHCDDNKIACYGTWDMGAHDYEPGIGHNRALYACPQTRWRKDSVKLIITGSTANRLKDENGNYYARGHYNEGFCWTIEEDSPDRLVLNISYTPRDIAGLPSMPPAAVFNGTLRDAALKGARYRYTFGSQSGVVEVDEQGDFTIDGVLLDSVVGMQQLILEPESVAALREWELVYVESNNSGKYALWDHGVGVGRIDGGFPESDIAIESKSGKQKIIHNCIH